jgi:mono/diheme cytochrome c family protein
MKLFLTLLLAAQMLSGQDLEARATAIIRANCLTCHSAAMKMGGLVLESRGAALQGGKSGPSIVPGNSAQSLLAEKVRSGKMPAGNPLPGADRELLAKWIDSGAPWSAKLAAVERKRAGKDWWSLQPLKLVPPHSEGAGMIDRYLADGRKTKGLTASPPADRRTLIRRATFDLTGLPPAPEEIQAFLSDSRPDAYERLIDRLLDSPAYGERWGRHWMDVIRFGESHGYEQNHLRPNAWQFRDYVIRSFNEDKPFDRLVEEHLAGDQIAPGDPSVEVGTGFLVAGPHDTVGNQAIAAMRQQRADDLDDMITATASAFLGLTVNCARCHDHKFDPIEQKDYYRMAAIFAGAFHGERDLATAEQERAHQRVVEPLERELKETTDRIAALKAAAEPQVKAREAEILSRYRPAADARLTEETFAPTNARYVRLHVEATTGGAAALDEIEVWSGDTNVALASSGAKAHASSVRTADDDKDAYSDQHLNDGRFDQRWIAADAKPVDITIELNTARTIERVSWSRDRTGGFQGRFEGPIPADYRIEVSNDGHSWRQVASSANRLPANAKQKEEMLLMAVFSDRQKADWRLLHSQQQDLRHRIAAIPKLPVAYIGRFHAPEEPIYLLRRGSVMDRGDVIRPASLSTLSQALPGFELDANAPEGSRRLALAKWITDRRNPLTPRVLANRLWHYHFGHGLVGTPSDFGFNGERPTHPELLDYLANRLLELDWHMKPLHKEIMLSAAYRQASIYDEKNVKLDSESRYLWRFPPRRLEAEAIRDTILAVSGKLDRRMGGPGFRLYRYTVDNVATYYPLERFGEDTYRRAVYQTAARSVRSELLGQYDCPDSSLPEPRRIVTTSPLQALALLNNSFLLDQSRFFAERLEREGATPAAHVARAFQLAFGRDPDAEERAAALQLIAQHGLFAFCRALFNANELLYVM